MISYYNRVGFAEFTLTIFIIALAVIMALSGMLYKKIEDSKKKDETIRILETMKVLNDAVSENNIHEVKHETIGKLLQERKVIHAEVNTSNGRHTIIFK